MIDQLRALAQRWKDAASAEVARVGAAGAVLEGIRSGCATELLALLDTLPVQPALTADEVRAVVREAYDAALGEEQPSIAEFVDDIADRVAEKLAGRTVDLAQHEADLREAFLAGWLGGENSIGLREGYRPASAPTDPEAILNAAEYARSKAANEHRPAGIRSGWIAGIEASIRRLESQARKPRDLWHPAYFAALDEALVHLRAMLARGVERAGDTVAGQNTKEPVP